ncbi:DUF1254 domain-containing protein [Pseudomonas sp. NPDC089569]|uniref:DUF1254 domain-containing protein n=1 Tax=Pseudomonas sp. NPDC089569 TaxID=3390722 RepID=UPI003CFD13B7
MTFARNLLASLIACSTLALSVPALAGKAQGVDSAMGPLQFESGYPTQATMTRLLGEMDVMRATEAYLWGIPVAGMIEWKNAQNNVFKVRDGQLVSYITQKQKQGILTPNYTTPYIGTFADLSRTGPLVLTLPKGLMAGMVMDVHQRVLEDLGVVGPDKGQGGKYLLLPPGQEKVAPEGYFVVQAKSNIVFFGVRLLGKDKDEAVRTLVPQISTALYNDGKPGEPWPVVPAGEQPWSQTPRTGMDYWKSIDQLVQQEVVEERDRFMMEHLRFLGIEKGKPFAPDAAQKTALEKGAVLGQAMAKANNYAKRFEPAFWPGTKWKNALNVSTNQRAPNWDQFDERASWFYEAASVSKAMLTQTPGVGQRYLVTYQDKDGHWLSGEHTYKLHVPANVPAKQFWSSTVYDEKERQMIVNDQKSPDIAADKSTLKTNADGSVDIYYGPKPVKGHEQNWVQTNPGEGWFTYFRFYAPTEAFFDKSWKMGDIERVQ